MKVFARVLARVVQRLRPPSVAECARVALLMSSNNDNNNVGSPLRTGGGGSGDSGSAHAMHRLRQVYVAHGGRIRTSWNAVLAATKPQRSGQATATVGDGSNGGGINGMEGGHRPPCGYSWALVRTRGVVDDEACSLACRVIEQGTVSDRSAGSRFTSGDGGRVVGSEGGGGDNVAGVEPSAKGESSALSPWRWHRFDVETTAWLPGDLLSLWIRLDAVRPFPRPSLAAGRDRVGGASAAEAAIGRGGRSWRRHSICYRPLVRSFELRAVDDARAEEIARGCYHALSRDCHQRSVASGGSTRFDGGSATAGTSTARLGDECFYAPAFPPAASGHCTSVAAVQLDFAAVSPMNMAAAGGSWA